MPPTPRFPALDGAATTIESLHWYAKGIGTIPRAVGAINEGFAHPKWWHISLRVTDQGLTTLAMPLADGATFSLALDLTVHALQLRDSRGYLHTFSLQEGTPARVLTERVRDTIAADLGLELDLDESKFDDDDPRPYDRAHAAAFLTALQSTQAVFADHVAARKGDWGPVQLWPHGFDIAVEWFGSRKVGYEEEGEVAEFSSQLNLGLSPGEASHPAPYFYSNPWPFEAEILKETALPAGRWRLDEESWQGSLLDYATVVAAADGAALLRAYAGAVFAAATPTLMA